MSNKYKLHAKLFLEGSLELVTGLTIGGSTDDVAIGGIDNNVIKTSDGTPYIPGSSLKGKIRSLIEKKEGENICSCGNEECDICSIFGTGASKNVESGPTRFYVRDAMLNEDIKEDMFEKRGIFSELELTYTESKWENVIDRETSKAKHPRQTERVPAGAIFESQFTYNIMCQQDIERFKEVIIGLRMLEDDYLGASGSRGYGKIKINNFRIGLKRPEEYETDNKKKDIFEGELDNLKFEDIRSELIKMLGFDNDESN